jgi:putative methyltransferase (TIGR04325 family)
MHKALKNRIVKSLGLLPYGHDLYLQLARKRLGITYRGVFNSCREAAAKVEPQTSSQYDVINQHKSEHLDDELPALEHRVLDIDYPMLFWLSRVLKPDDTVLELGGSIGQGFYSFERYFPYPGGIQWTIAELPAAVTAGERLAKRRGEARLGFIDSARITEGIEADVFLTAGTLQYMDIALPDILSAMASLPEHVIIHNLPAHPSRDFWTLQYLSVCEVPYHIIALDTLTGSLQALGYQLVDRWKHPRSIEIPYHAANRVEHYHGLYLHRTTNGRKP